MSERQSMQKPVWEDGAWNLGNERILDPDKTLFQEVEHYPTISVIKFKLLFTTQERVAINGARKTDNIIDDYLRILNDPRLSDIDLNLPIIAEALQYFVSQSILNSDRPAQILKGE